MTASKTGIGAGIGAGVLALVLPLVAYYEGMVPKTYADPVGILTICYGHTGAQAKPGNELPPEQCRELLSEDVLVENARMRQCVTRPMPTHVEVAFTSFSFNVGAGAFCRSTLLRRWNAGDHAGACAELSRWVYAGNRKLRGLEKRRESERAVCEGRTEWLVTASS
jgi:lysozyme